MPEWKRAPGWKELLLWGLVVAGPLGIACMSPPSTTPPPAVKSPDGASEALVDERLADPLGGLPDSIVFCLIERKACENPGPPILTADGEAQQLTLPDPFWNDAILLRTFAKLQGSFDPALHRIDCYETRKPVDVGMGDAVRVKAIRNTDGDVDTQPGFVAATRSDLMDGTVDQGETAAPGAAPADCASSAAGTFTVPFARIDLSLDVGDYGFEPLDAYAPHEVQDFAATTCANGDRGVSYHVTSAPFGTRLERITTGTCPDAAPTAEWLIDPNTVIPGCGSVLGVGNFATACGDVVATVTCGDALAHVVGYDGSTWTNLVDPDQFIDGYHLYGMPFDWSGDCNESRSVFWGSVLAEEQATTTLKRPLLGIEKRVGQLGLSTSIVPFIPFFPEVAAERPRVDAAGPPDEQPGELHTPRSGNFSFQFLSRASLAGPYDGLWQWSDLDGTLEKIADLSAEIPWPGITALGPGHDWEERCRLLVVTTAAAHRALLHSSGGEFELVVEVTHPMLDGIDTVSSLGGFECTADGFVYTVQTSAGRAALVQVDRHGEQRVLFGSDRTAGGGTVTAIELAPRSVVGGGPSVPGGGIVAAVAVDGAREIGFLEFPHVPELEPLFMFVQPWSSFTNRVQLVTAGHLTVTTLGEPATKSLSGLARDPTTGTIVATTGVADGGRCHSVDRSSGALTLIGDDPNVLAIPGADFNRFGQLFASIALNSIGERWLAQLDTSDCGTTVVGQLTWSGQPAQGVESLAFCDDHLYGGTGSSFAQGVGIAEIDPNTGVILSHQAFPGVTSTIAGLTCSCDERLFGSGGGGSGELWEFDVDAGTVEWLGDLAGTSIPDLVSLDCDGDGLDDYDEGLLGTVVNDPDSDSDGVEDGDEAGFATSPLDPDSDGDGLLDGYEVLHGLDPAVADDTTTDVDGDLLTLAEEGVLRTDPFDDDSDDDGILDGAEVGAGSPLLAAASAAALGGNTNPLRADSDGDGLADGVDPDPLDPDSDDDGMSDGAEAGLFAGPMGPVSLDPLDPDTDGDGLLDGVDPEPAIPAPPPPALPAPMLPLAGLVALAACGLLVAGMARR